MKFYFICLDIEVDKHIEVLGGVLPIFDKCIKLEDYLKFSKDSTLVTKNVKHKIDRERAMIIYDDGVEVRITFEIYLPDNKKGIQYSIEGMQSWFHRENEDGTYTILNVH